MPDEGAHPFQAVVLMGVAGSGKTTIGQLLAEQTSWDFIEGDDFHPPENIRKMSAGVPLTDADRLPWLESLHQALQAHAQRKRPVVLACSALKQEYRRILSAGIPNLHFIYLKGSYDLLAQRLAERPMHYMKAGMLASQFETLQEPQQALTLDVSDSPQAICAAIQAYLEGVNQPKP
ncbi:MAG: gluconokinase [Chloroflexota bacterium]|nr:gluconokinase [Chloroflexota bacterium]